MKPKIGDHFYIGDNKAYTYKITKFTFIGPSKIKISFICIKGIYPMHLNQKYEDYIYTFDQITIIKPKFIGHRLTKIFK